MPDTLRRLSGPALLSAVAATVYTVPAATTTVVRSVHVANTGAASALFTLSIGADAAGTRLYSRILIPPGGTLDWNGLYVAVAGEIIQAFSSVADILTLTMSGIEVT